jgi:hypothetical protein
MQDILRDIIRKAESRRRPIKHLLLKSGGSLRQKFSDSFVSAFLALGPQQIFALCKKSQTALFVLLQVQCMLRDVRSLRHISEQQLLEKHKMHNGDMFSLRYPINEVRLVDGLPFYGSKEPFRSKIPTPSSWFHAARMRFIKDVLGVKRLIVFEARNFSQEAEMWKLIQDKDESFVPATLIAIKDMTFPTSDALVRFGLELNDAFVHRFLILGHCVAGNGRTGFCLLFVLMFHLWEFDFVSLLISLAERYKLRASCEILYMVNRCSIDLSTIYLGFRKAYLELQQQLPSNNRCLFKRSTSPPRRARQVYFTPTDMRRLSAFHIKLHS